MGQLNKEVLEEIKKRAEGYKDVYKRQQLPHSLHI